MKITINTGTAIPLPDQLTVRVDLLRRKGVTRVEVLTNSISVDIPIKDGNEDYPGLVTDLAALEGYYQKN